LVIPYALKYIHKLTDKTTIIPSVVDYGCGEGHLLAHIKRNIDRARPTYPVRFVGVDYNSELVKKATEQYPDIEFEHLDLLKEDLQHSLKRKFDIAIAVNTVHEVFSFSSGNGHFDEKKGLRAVRYALKNIIRTIKKGGQFILFDGVEHDGNLKKQIELEILHRPTIDCLKLFQQTYKPMHVKITWLSKDKVRMNLKTFTRFITKTVFLDTPTWKMEQNEMYQYYRQEDFEETFNKLGLSIEAKLLISPNLGLWKSFVKILTPNVSFPHEHILISATKK
jgi:SAM-dependent methyltransferase